MLDALPSLPATAPFTTAQRAWLDGWLAGFCLTPAGTASVPSAPSALPPAPVDPVATDQPWHDMTLPLEERFVLAAGRPLRQRLMAAMAQQDCGQCGYLCESYAAALADGSEKSAARCVPGGRETARALKELLETPVAATPLPASPAPPVPTSAGATTSVAAAPLAEAALLSRPGSQKETRHVAFDLAGTGLSYEVGDVLGIQPQNSPEEVAAIIALLRAKPGDDIDGPDGVRRSLETALLDACDITRVSDEAVEVLASRARDLDESQRLQALAEGYPGAEPEGADLLELLQTFPSARPPLQELISALAPLQPRFYSIASSPKIAGAAVHLTVATVRYEMRGRRRSGVASGYLADRVPPGGAVPIFVRKALDFRLPADDDAPLIMIGPGTGIAPFRAFLHERQAIKAPGRNWLFLGVIALLVIPIQMTFVPVLQILNPLGLTKSYAGIWLAHTAFGLPFAIFLLRNFFVLLPPDLLESARIDGASNLRIFYRIVLPLSVPALASLTIFQFLGVWNDLLMALVFIQNPDARPLTVAISGLQSTYGVEWDLLSAGAFLLMIVPLIVFFSLQRYFVQGLLAGSVK